MKKSIFGHLSGYKNLASLVLILISISAFSQTGVFYFEDKASSHNNNKIVDIIEIGNSELCLLGKLTDSEYQNPKPYYLHLDNQAKKLKQTILNSTSMFS